MGRQKSNDARSRTCDVAHRSAGGIALGVRLDADRGHVLVFFHAPDDAFFHCELSRPTSTTARDRAMLIERGEKRTTATRTAEGSARRGAASKGRWSTDHKKDRQKPNVDGCESCLTSSSCATVVRTALAAPHERETDRQAEEKRLRAELARAGASCVGLCTYASPPKNLALEEESEAKKRAGLYTHYKYPGPWWAKRNKKKWGLR